jgi:hypothetical protein
MILRNLPVQARGLQHKPIEVGGFPYLVSWYETKFCTKLESGYRGFLVLLDSALCAE